MRIGEDERDVLASEARALAERLEDPAARDAYRALADRAELGEVPDDWADRVGTLTALALETGRARAIYGPPGIRALAAVWKRTPQAGSVATSLEELNEALRPLRGLPLSEVRVAATEPGAFSIGIAAGAYEVRLSVDRSGVRLRSLNVGGGGVGE